MEKQKTQCSIKGRTSLGGGIKDMAQSPSHLLGQIIGDLLEEAIIDFYKPVAHDLALYLDYKHPRPARNGNKVVSWRDINGNLHDLDIVMENGGSESVFGAAKAFIEVAWRRYTKHSKNKVQEVSAAILPIVRGYGQYCPFYGAVLAGEFTDTALDQLRSEGFAVVHLPIEVIWSAFQNVGIDIFWDEETSEDILQKKVSQCSHLTEQDREIIKSIFIRSGRKQIDTFTNALRSSVQRYITKVMIASLYGNVQEFSSIQEACVYIMNTPPTSCNVSFMKYEIRVVYSNGSYYDMVFGEPQEALRALNQFMT